jgi:hypothetical protein
MEHQTGLAIQSIKESDTSCLVLTKIPNAHNARNIPVLGTGSSHRDRTGQSRRVAHSSSTELHLEGALDTDGFDD